MRNIDLNGNPASHTASFHHQEFRNLKKLICVLYFFAHVSIASTFMTDERAGPDKSFYFFVKISFTVLITGKANLFLTSEANQKSSTDMQKCGGTLFYS